MEADKFATTEQEHENIYLSVVIPVFNEEGNVDNLLKNLHDNIQPMGMNYEIILVDDGSGDRTWEKIARYSRINQKVKGIRLARNFGHQHALLAGLSHAKGQAIISMDGDLQHPPSLIRTMIEEHKKGNLVVNTCRNDKEVASLFKRKTSSWFYKVFSSLTGVPMSAGSSDFRLLDRTALTPLLELKDVDLFLRGAVEWLGFPSVTISYTAGERFSGVSKYSLSKMVKLAKGSIISFSTKPLIVGVWLGIITSIFAFIEIIYVLFQVARGDIVPGWASTVGLISFLFGILFIILGIIGTYLARIHVILQNRPKFIIRDITENEQK